MNLSLFIERLREDEQADLLFLELLEIEKREIEQSCLFRELCTSACCNKDLKAYEMLVAYIESKLRRTYVPDRRNL